MTLYLIPNTLGGKNPNVLPLEVLEVSSNLQGIIAESEGRGRAFLRLLKISKADVFPLALLNKNNSISYLDFLLDPIIKGENWGLISDAGLPCIADPGSFLIRRAREKKVKIRAFSGPCSITMALMLSGFSGQKFTFAGYPPQQIKERNNFFKKCEEESKKNQRVIIFIESPCRNKYTFLSLLDSLSLETYLSVSCNLTLIDEYVETLSVKQWKELDISIISDQLAKKPTIFIIYSECFKNTKTSKKRP